MGTFETDEEQGIYFRQKTYNPLSRSEEARLIRSHRAGDEKALDKLIRANMRFVITICRDEYAGRGLSMAELISEGTMGLLEALKRYDEARGFKLITYAVWWIRNCIQQKLEEKSIVPHPVNVHVLINKRIRAERELEGECGGSAPRREANARAGLTASQVAVIDSYERGPVSLDGLAYREDYDDGGRSMAETSVMADPDAEEEVVRAVEEKDVVEMMRGFLDTLLDERQRLIIEYCYGMDGRIPLTLTQIAPLVGCTRARVGQLRDKALLKLRKHPRSRNVVKEFSLHLVSPPTGERERIGFADQAILEKDEELHQIAQGTTRPSIAEEITADIEGVFDKSGVAEKYRHGTTG